MKICAKLVSLKISFGNFDLHPKPPLRRPQIRERAEELAVEALGFLAAEPERLQHFLSLSGLEVVNLRQSATQPGFLAGVLAHLASDEALLLEFAAAGGHKPEDVGAACMALNPGFE